MGPATSERASEPGLEGEACPQARQAQQQQRRVGPLGDWETPAQSSCRPAQISSSVTHARLLRSGGPPARRNTTQAAQQQQQQEGRGRGRRAPPARGDSLLCCRGPPPPCQSRGPPLASRRHDLEKEGG